jgi:CDGSH-type Zn-finger protein
MQVEPENSSHTAAAATPSSTSTSTSNNGHQRASSKRNRIEIEFDHDEDTSIANQSGAIAMTPDMTHTSTDSSSSVEQKKRICLNSDIQMTSNLDNDMKCSRNRPICNSTEDLEELRVGNARLWLSEKRDSSVLPPIVPCYYPFRCVLKPGQMYRWCACGRSKTQPWCDNVCLQYADEPKPIVLAVRDESRVQICGCKYTGSAPICDGSHIHPRTGYAEEP